VSIKNDFKNKVYDLRGTVIVSQMVLLAVAKGQVWTLLKCAS
jgi:hypothetical protein